MSLIKPCKVVDGYKFTKIPAIDKTSSSICHNCKYYNINRNDHKTLCIKRENWFINKICRKLVRIAPGDHYAYIPPQNLHLK